MLEQLAEPRTEEVLDPSLSMTLSEEQQVVQRRFRRFVDERISPFAGEWDRAACIPEELIEELRKQGFLGAPLPTSAGGREMAPITYGLLTAEIGRGCSSVRSLLTVHDMVTLAILRWGNRWLQTQWVPALASGRKIAAFALTEPEVGSDAASIRTEARSVEGGFVLKGRKTWITFGQIADIFLVFARTEKGLAAFLVPADTPGFVRRPIVGMVGTRASQLAEIDLDDCRVPADHLVGREGFGISHVALTALDHGRYSVAWGALGIAEACVEGARAYAAKRHQFGAALQDHALVQRKLTEMIVESRAARLLCYRAGWARETGSLSATVETLIAKYHASRTATRLASDAVQLHGANGLSEKYPFERHVRDARVTEIIEGSTQILQQAIATSPLEAI